MNFVLSTKCFHWKLMSLSRPERIWRYNFLSPRPDKHSWWSGCRETKLRGRGDVPHHRRKWSSPKVMSYMELMRMSSGAWNKGIRMALALPEGRSAAQGDGLGKRERKTWGANKKGYKVRFRPMVGENGKDRPGCEPDHWLRPSAGKGLEKYLWDRCRIALGTND